MTQKSKQIFADVSEGVIARDCKRAGLLSWGRITIQKTGWFI